MSTKRKGYVINYLPPTSHTGREIELLLKVADLTAQVAELTRERDRAGHTAWLLRHPRANVEAYRRAYSFSLGVDIWGSP